MNERDHTTVIPRLRDLKLPRHDPWGEDARHPEPQRPVVHPTGVVSWLIPGLVMLGLGLLGVTRPSLWADELQTWGMATTPWPEMLAVLRWVGAIIGPYYAVEHAWVGLVGVSDLTLRLPSVIAMAAAAGLVGALGARLATHRVGLMAGLVFAVLPGTSRYAQEARTYAFTTFFAVLATYLLFASLRRPNFPRYLLYTIAVLLMGVLHPIALLLLVAHGWVVFAQYRRQTLPWLVTAFFAAAPALPLLRLAGKQKSQVAWIPHPTRHSLMVFPQDLVGVFAIGILLIVLAMFSLPLRRPTAMYTAWAVLPLLGLFAAGQVTPLFLPRYLMFTLPAWALLAGVALGRAHLAVAIAGVLAIAALAVPAQIAVRAPDGHGEATRQMALTIAGQSQPGDAVVYGMTDDGGSWVGRDSVNHYISADRRPRVVLMTVSSRTSGNLAAQECAEVARCLGDTPRIWVVRLGYRADPLRGLDGQKEPALRDGYELAQTWHFTGLTLALVTRRTAG